MALPEEVVQITERFLLAADKARPGAVSALLLHGSLCWVRSFQTAMSALSQL